MSEPHTDNKSHADSHSHGHGHGHNHDHRHTPLKSLIAAIFITLGFALIEALTGYFSHSLTLMSDAGHMATDSFALMIAAGAAWLAIRPRTDTHSYGFGRAEVLAASISSLFMIVIAIGIILEAIQRFHQHTIVQSLPVIIVGIIGMLINALIAWILSRGEQNFNTRAAILHVLSDLLGSVAAVLSGLVIYWTQWMLIDPILSLFISILILLSSVRLLYQTMLVLMETVPKNLNIKRIANDITTLDNIIEVHDMHVWSLSSNKIMLTAHVSLAHLTDWQQTLPMIQNMLRDNYQITHITIQPETQTFVMSYHAFHNKPI